MIIFFFSGLSIIPYVGIQTDEAIFSEPLFLNGYSAFELSVFKKKIPLMVMSYLGATKTWLYWFVFGLWEPSVCSLRVPSLLAGVGSLIAFFCLLRRILGNRAACLGTALLAFDSSYLMATTMDWGPVAIQHLCFTAGLAWVVSAHQTGSWRALAAGFLCFGLGCWDKALFVWMLSGAGLAALCIFFTEVKRKINVRSLFLAGFFFLLGALPLVIYNIRRPLETFRGNTSLSADDLTPKLYQLPGTLTGGVFFGFLVEEDWAVKPRKLTGWERGVVSWTARFGERREHLYWYGFLAALLLSPVLLWSEYRRHVAFCLLTMAIAWAQMLATKGAGGGAHHTLLLWPLPILLITIAAVWAADRVGRYGTAFLVTVGFVLCGSAALVNQYYLTQAIKNGAPGNWSNAALALARRLPAYDADRIYLADWGMLDNTRMLTQGELPLFLGSEPLMREQPGADDRKNAALMIEDRRGVFVSNTDDRQVFPEVNKRLLRLAADLGYEREVLEVIHDFNGRPAFQIFRFRNRGSSGLATTRGKLQ
ncbi:MAG: glycosyltransferase family 39 protein [Acidobacteria bacterium]|nr:glycosyltransferase family 39 protein [Acidobacteriota bacterium]